MPLLPLIAAKSQKRQRHLAGKAGEPPPPPPKMVCAGQESAKPKAKRQPRQTAYERIST